MRAAPNRDLPEELLYLIEGVDALPTSTLAARALPHLERLSDFKLAVEIAAELLTRISRSNCTLAKDAARTLWIISSVSSHPRPRVAVAITALRGFALRDVA
jgi:hypothetical protein